MTGRMEEYDEHNRGPTLSERADDGVDASVYVRSGASALIPRPSAAFPREDTPRPDLMLIAAVMKTTVWVSNLLV
jgi:hypothetical protein